MNYKIIIEKGEVIEKIFINNVKNYSQIDILLSKIYIKFSNINKKNLFIMAIF